MGSGDEVVDIVDIDDKAVGTAVRRDVRAQNLLHRATYIVVRNSEGKYAVQKRTTIKDYCPGYFDPVTGGVVSAGESYEVGAQRELEEEIGAVGATPKFCFKFLYEDDVLRSWCGVFDVLYDGPVTLQESEVESLHWMTLEEIYARRDAGELFTPDGMVALDKFREWASKAT